MAAVEPAVGAVQASVLSETAQTMPEAVALGVLEAGGVGPPLAEAELLAVGGPDVGGAEVGGLLLGGAVVGGLLVGGAVVGGPVVGGAVVGGVLVGGSVVGTVLMVGAGVFVAATVVGSSGLEATAEVLEPTLVVGPAGDRACAVPAPPRPRPMMKSRLTAARVVALPCGRLMVGTPKR